MISSLLEKYSEHTLVNDPVRKKLVCEEFRNVKTLRHPHSTSIYFWFAVAIHYALYQYKQPQYFIYDNTISI